MVTKKHETCARPTRRRSAGLCCGRPCCGSSADCISIHDHVSSLMAGGGHRCRSHARTTLLLIAVLLILMITPGRKSSGELIALNITDQPIANLLIDMVARAVVHIGIQKAEAP